MSHSVCRLLILAGLLACAAIAGPIAAAQASNASIVTTVKKANPVLIRDELRVANTLLAYRSSHKTAPAARALDNEVKDLHTLTGKLRGQSASTNRGAQGKAQVLKGLSLIAKAYAALGRDFAGAHGTAVPAAKLKAAVATDKAGRTALLKGAKLLS